MSDVYIKLNVRITLWIGDQVVGMSTPIAEGHDFISSKVMISSPARSCQRLKIWYLFLPYLMLGI